MEQHRETQRRLAKQGDELNTNMSAYNKDFNAFTCRYEGQLQSVSLQVRAVPSPRHLLGHSPGILHPPPRVAPGFDPATRGLSPA